LRRVLLATLLVLLAAPAAADATVVPQKSIAGVRLGMTQTQVRAELGRPGRIKQGNNDFGPFTQFVYSKRKIVVSFQGRTRVTSVYTSSRSQRTSKSVGVGSSEHRLLLRVRHVRCETFGNDVRSCHVGRFEGGRVVTDFRLRRKRVVNVTVGRVID
jgi:hypothetical protein